MKMAIIATVIFAVIASGLWFTKIYMVSVTVRSNVTHPVEGKECVIASSEKGVAIACWDKTEVNSK